MGLLDKIEEIQQKPKQTRFKILIFSVVVIMVLIIGLWISLPEARKTNTQENNDMIGPLKMMYQDAKNFMSGFR
ncbi:MAG: hypothetical protein COU46_00880 [Candidatus Niyogibacteria bacterium CG10_big_fil_rev_8_21_14_0_10_42_19]|uniref:Uncharacterized protein n=1 Tax=Candidatus Niyogibacteria bacterium CG10_big_fil_rev_8_21_14_0_10_42_19 TaxID=1974725 RepID=A0A2H0TG71_9BACT|nr:MAG: hypothetical protein COU46_00880 [Candidatus Niyogibacteria bacterium CG10_big_fil_rev_8_21_14_0_10_42_19]